MIKNNAQHEVWVKFPLGQRKEDDSLGDSLRKLWELLWRGGGEGPSIIYGFSEGATHESSTHFMRLAAGHEADVCINDFNAFLDMREDARNLAHKSSPENIYIKVCSISFPQSTE